MARPDPIKVLSGACLLAATTALLAWDLLGGHTWGATGLIALAAGLGSLEFSRMGLAGGHRPALLPGLLATLALLAAATRGWETWALTAGLVLPALFAIFLARRPGPETLVDLGLTVVGVVYLGLLGAFPVRLLGHGETGLRILIWIVLVTKVADIGAYFGGRAFGRRRLAPVLSPGKTWEGGAAGAAAAVGVSLLLVPWLLPGGSPPWFAAAAGGILVAVVGQVGDLAESLLKRCLAVKDSSSLIPAYGGVLDVIDSLLFAVPVVTTLLHLFPAVLPGGPLVR